jgi:hypothetical protein
MAPSSRYATPKGRPPATGHVDAAREAAAVGTAGVHGGADDHEQAGDVPPLQRKLDDAVALDHFADAGALHVNQRRGRVNGDGFFQSAELERHVDGGRRRDLEHDSGLDVRLESLQAYLESIGAWREVRYEVRALGVGDDAAGGAGFSLGHRHGDTGQHRAARVGDLARQLRGGNLRERRGAQE